MSEKSHFVRGLVLQEESGAPLLDVMIEVVRGVGPRAAPVGRGLTTNGGRFEIRLSSTDLQRMRGPLELRLSYHGVPVELLSGGQRRIDPRRIPNELVLCVNPPHICSSPKLPFKQDPGQVPCVWGVIRHADGTRVEGLTVKAFKVNLAGETPITTPTDTTNAQGVYQITSTNLGSGANLIVRAYKAGTLVGTSKIAFQCPPQTRIDLVVDADACRGPSEFATVKSRIDAAQTAAGTTTPLTEFSRSQILYIAALNKLEVEPVLVYVIAYRIADAMDATTYHEQVYGLLRLGWPRAIPTFLSRPRGGVPAALVRAAKKGFISGDAVDASAAFLTAWVEALVSKALDPATNGAVGPVLGAGGVNSTNQETLLQLWMERSGSVADFWDVVRAHGTLGSQVAPIQRALKIALICANHIPMVGKVSETLGTQDIETLSTWEADDWDVLIADSWETYDPIGAPDGYDPTSYRELLLANVEAAFPSLRARTRLRADAATPEAVKDYLDANSSFDLARSPIVGTGDHLKYLRKAQRLYRVSPTTGRYDTLTALSTKFDSARSIDRYGRRRFITEYSATLGEDVAMEVYNKARALSSLAVVSWGILSPTLAGPKTAVMADRDDTGTEDIPNYEALFGSLDWCGCDECLTITSPAAYLADLLCWVDDLGGWSEDPSTDTDALNARRPDLGRIELSCENTFRVLPYVDLVNEILENAVADKSGGIVPTTTYQTTLQTSELLVTPENINLDAYTALSTATFSHKLPFHDANALSRVYLAHMGVPREHLLRVCQHTNSSPISDLGLAVEELGLCDVELGMLTDDAVPATVEERWGVDSTWEEIASVETFLLKADITFAQLLEILHCRTPNPSGTLTLYYEDPCDTSAIWLSTSASSKTLPGDTEFLRLSRFLRVWRAMGGTPLEVDRALVAIGVSDVGDDTKLNTAAVTNLGRLKRLGRLTHTPRHELCALWDTLDLYADREAADEPQRSHYERLFLDPTTFPDAATDPDTWVLRLNSTATGPERSTEDLWDHVSELSAALRMDISEIEDAILWSSAATVTYATPHLMTLSNLSSVARRALLARTLGLRVDQTSALVTLLGIDALSTSNPFISPENATTLVEEVIDLRASALSIDELLYLACHDADAVSRVAPADSALAELLGGLRDHLRGVAGDYDQSSEESAAPEADLTALLNETFPSASWISAFLTLVDEAWYTGSTSLAADQDAAWTTLLTTVSTGTPSLADRIDVRDLRAKLIGYGGAAPALTTDATRYAYALAALTWGNYRAENLDALRDAISEKLGGLIGRTRGLVDHLRALAFSAVPAYASGAEGLDAFLTRSFLAFETADADDAFGDIARSGGAVADAMDDAYALAEIVGKVAMLFGRLKMSEEDEDWWFGDAGDTSAADLDLVDLSTLQVVADDGETRYAGLKRTLDLFRQRARLPGNEPGFADLLTTLGDTPTFLAGLAERTSWLSADLDAIADAFGYASTVSLTDTEELERLIDAMDIVRRVGAGASAVLAWVTHAAATGGAYDASSTDAAAILSAARSRHTDVNTWLTVARPLRDALREQQRRALVAWLLDHMDHDFEDTEDLYAHYLIDVEMGPSMLTSRIKQAACSVQLFVQRTLLGLDAAALTLTDDDRDEWEWMKTYRIWEAARKVFLYPENFIEPELRDDRSPFFKELEAELGQGELDEDRLEAATLNYLDKLREVHNLHTLGLVQQSETVDGETIDILHVLSRTRSTPPVYYYRRWEDKTTWTAWEKVTCGPEGEHVLPVIYNRRLLLFWVTFEEDSSSSSENDVMWWNIRLNWSEYREGRWTPKQVSKDPLSLQSSSEFHNIFQFYYVLHADNTDGLTLHFVQRKSWTSVGSFSFDPCTLELIPSPGDATFTERRPLSQSPYYQGYVITDGEIEGDQKLSMYAGSTLYGTAPEYPLFGLETPEAKIAVARQYENFTCQTPFFYEDSTRNFFVRYMGSPLGGLMVKMETDAIGLSELDDYAKYAIDATLPTSGPGTDVGYDLSYGDVDDIEVAIDTEIESSGTDDASPDATGEPGLFLFAPFQHPYVCTFIEEVRRNGVMGLLAPSESGSTATLARQQINDATIFDPYLPTTNVDDDHPKDEVDFSTTGAYSLYNWELFFHMPCYVAGRLSDDQQFQEAMDWYHTVFDPRSQNTEYEIPDRYWKIRPFIDEDIGPSVQDWEAFTGQDGDSEQALAFEEQVAEWRDDPFNPHLLARLRPGTYQKTIFMKYLDNLIAWGDALFQQDTIETLNEATQLYVFANELLGDRPVELDPLEKPTPKTWEDLRSDPTLDEFSNVLVAVESTLFSTDGTRYGGGSTAPTPSLGLTAYFCVPPNEKLLGYWDTVADRLFKIRNGLNLAGVRRSLPLFEPPIDPALLVRARAMGVDIRAALDSSSGALPNYRFSALYARAQAYVGSVKALGGALLSALEKKDAEALALLRSSHERAVADATIGVRRQQIEDAEAALAALKKSKDMVKTRRKYYQRLMDKGWNNLEKKQFDQTQLVFYGHLGSAGFYAVKAIAALIPQVHAGIAAALETGGSGVAMAAEAAGQLMNSGLAALNTSASLAGLQAGFQRRAQEWAHQLSLAEKELDQIDKQMLGAEIRIDIAKRELKNQELQVDNAAELDAWMRSKYTNEELYTWMVGQISGLYFSSYELAVDMARKAETAWRHELGVPGSAYIQFGYWDSLKKGLLAGERLTHDLDRLESAYLDQDVRELEITRHVSLDLLDPMALATLREDETHTATFTLPEALFDLDFPGHYFRRIQSIAVTVAAVSGPQAGVNVELALSSTALRREADASASLETVTGLSECIVTSGGLEDSGLFQTDLRDPRYLPFERRGLVNSAWQIRLANAIPGFDPASISDVILHVRYTARKGDDTFRTDVVDAIHTQINAMTSVALASETGPWRAFSAAKDFPDDWYRFLHPTGTAGGNTLSLTLSDTWFPYAAQARGFTRSKVTVLVRYASAVAWGSVTGLAATAGTPSVTVPAPTSTTPQLGVVTTSHTSSSFSLGFSNTNLSAATGATGLIETIDTGVYRLDADAIEDVIVIVHYDLAAPPGP